MQVGEMRRSLEKEMENLNRQYKDICTQVRRSVGRSVGAAWIPFRSARPCHPHGGLRARKALWPA